MHIESTISHPDFSPSASPTSAKTNETLLIECFQASLTCLHYISHLSPSQYAMCSMADQSKFCYCLIIVLKLGLYLDYGRLHRLQISESLLRLCEIDKKLTNTPVEKTEASVLLDTYSHSLRILQNANTWFLETTREENGYGRNWGELNDISPFQLLEKKPVDQNLSMGQQNHMPLDILDRSWDDLAMEWLMPVDGQLLG